MALKRTPHWATREFHQFLVARAKTPFQYGTNDCSMFAADAIKAITGTDIAAEFRGTYNDAPSSLRAIHRITGGTTVEDAAVWIAKKHGLEERQHPLTAQRGDLVLIPNADGTLIAGVVHLNGRHAVSVGENGVQRFSISTVKRAWKI